MAFNLGSGAAASISLQVDGDRESSQKIKTVGDALNNMGATAGTVQSALAGLGVALSVGAFVKFMKGAIDTADHLKDLSKSTGIAVEDLAGLSLLARQTGTDLDGLAKGINKMSVEMGKDPEKFRALGITAKTNTGALKQFADLFNTLPDINQRNALAQAVFGKSWQDLAPVLSEGGKSIGETIEKGKRLSGITTEMADAADAFNDKLAELGGTGAVLNRMVAPLLPLLNALADDMLKAQNEAIGMADGGFSPLAETLRAVVVIGGNMAFVLKSVGNEIGGIAAQIAAFASGDFAGVVSIGKMMKEDAVSARKEFDAWEQKMLTVGTATGKVKDAVKELSKAEQDAAKKAAAEASAKTAAFLGQQDAAKKAAAAALKAQDTFINGIHKEFETLGMSTAQAKLHQAALLGITGVRLKNLDVELAEIDAYNEAVKVAGARAGQRNAEEAGIASYFLAQQEGYNAAVKGSQDALKAAQDEYAQMGLSRTRIAEITLARLNDQMTATDGPAPLVDALQIQIDKQKELIGVLQKIEVKNDLLDAPQKAAHAWRDAGEDIADALERAFKKGGKSAGDMVKAMTYGIANQIKIDEKYGEEKKKAGADLAAIEKRHIDESTRNSLQSFGDMAGAAKGFFDEKSKGYQVLAGIEKAMFVAKLAMDAQSMISSLAVTGKAIIAGAAKFFEQSGWAGFAGVAAMLAVIAGLGGSSGGGVSATPTYQDRQKKQGTGTVLGDPDAKSDSLANSMAIVERNSSIELGYQYSMVHSLKNIETALGSAAKGLFQTVGLTGGSAFGTIEESTKSFWGSDESTTITDSGIRVGGTMGQLRSGQGSGVQYEDITKWDDGGWFHGDSTERSTRTKGLEESVMRPFSLIFDNLGNLLVDAGVKLGMDGASLTDRINKVVIDFGVSTRNLTGQDLVDALAAGVGVALDQVATEVFPELVQFQKIGEGMGETVIRIASNYSALDSMLASIGMTFGAVGISSVAARERLIGLAGGVDELAQQTGFFAENFLSEAERLAPVQKYVTDEMTAMGLAGITTREQFKNVVLGIDLTTEAGQNLYARLMRLAPAFAETTKETDDLADTLGLEISLLNAQGRSHEALVMQRESDIASMSAEEAAIQRQINAAEDLAKTRGLEIQIMELSGNKAGAVAAQRQIEMNALSAGDQQLQLRIYALQDEAAAVAAANQVSAERFSLESQYAQLNGDNTLSRIAELQAIDPANRAMKIRIWALQDEQAAAKNVAQASGNVASAYQDATKSQQTYLQGLVKFGQSISEFLKGLEVSNNPATSPLSRLNAARDQYLDDLRKAREGDVDAQARLVTEAQTYIAAGTEYYASGAGAQAIIAQIKAEMGALPALVDLDKNLLALHAIEAAVNAVNSSTQSSGASVVSAVDVLPFVLTEETLKLLDNLNTNFNDLDTNVDNLLGFNEFKEGLEGKASDAEIRALFDLTDTNHDGMISKLEAINTSAKRIPGDIKLLLGPKFDDLTKTTSGVLTSDQFVLAFTGTASDDTLRDIFKNIDMNSDGVIDKLEAGNTNTSKVATDSELLQYIRENTYHPTPQSRELLEHLQYIRENVYNPTPQSREIYDALHETLRVTSANQSGSPMYFANGGIFDRATAFNIGVMGEAGPEAIMPLTNINGRLGVSVAGQDNREMVAELKALRSEVAQLRGDVKKTTATVRDSADVIANATHESGGNVVKALKPTVRTKKEGAMAS